MTISSSSSYKKDADPLRVYKKYDPIYTLVDTFDTTTGTVTTSTAGTTSLFPKELDKLLKMYAIPKYPYSTVSAMVDPDPVPSKTTRPVSPAELLHNIDGLLATIRFLKTA